MYSPQEALNEVLAHIHPLPESSTGQPVPLKDAVGRVLAADIVSDLDLPPFEKSAMDGYAVHSSDFEHNEGPTLRIVGESRAGEPFTGDIPPGSCVAIYTGAECPKDVNAVIMVEQAEPIGEDQVRLTGPAPAAQHVCHRGQDLRLGELVLAGGTRVRPADISVLAAVGSDPVLAAPRPKVAILTTGDELVPPSQKPGEGQIREGNTLQLAALSRLAGADVAMVGWIPDDPKQLEEVLGQALDTCDAVVTTGGVSMGKYDLVGDAFEKLGVQNVFHKVKIKPGKPLWFGLRGQLPVFALPGNPVSCLVSHTLFVTPALQRMGGERSDWLASPDIGAACLRGVWCASATKPHWREQFLPAQHVSGSDGRLEVRPAPWNGSGDVVGLSKATCLVRIPADMSLQEQAVVEFLPLPQ